MRTAQCSTAQVKQLLEIATQGARVIRELEVDGWGSFLEAQDAIGDIIPSKPHPCYRCRRPQTPCKAGVEEDDAGDPARPSVDISSCSGTAHSSPRQFSLFVPVPEMDSEVVRTLGSEDAVTVRPLPDAQSGQHAWCTWAISQPGPTLASDCWVLWLKNVTLEGASGPALLECLKAALSGFSGTLLLVIPALTALLARQLRGLHLRLIPRADNGTSPIWWCVSESLWAGLASFASRAVTGPEGQVLIDWCRWVLSGESGLPEAGFSSCSTCRHLPGLWPSASHPPSLGGGGSVPKSEAAEEERVGEALFEKASDYLDLCHQSTFSVDKAQQAGRLGAELILLRRYRRESCPGPEHSEGAKAGRSSHSCKTECL